MWIGSIRLRVKTKDATDAGTDSLVTATIVRDGEDIEALGLDYRSENDLERGAVRNYDYIGPTRLPRSLDKTLPLPPGISQNPMPYPDYGIEFSHGLKGHLTVRLQIYDDDMWIKDNVELHIKELRLKPTSFDTVDWQEDANWTAVVHWSKDTAMSTDSDEGFEILKLTF